MEFTGCHNPNRLAPVVGMALAGLGSGARGFQPIGANLRTVWAEGSCQRISKRIERIFCYPRSVAIAPSGSSRVAHPFWHLIQLRSSVQSAPKNPVDRYLPEHVLAKVSAYGFSTAGWTCCFLYLRRVKVLKVILRDGVWTVVVAVTSWLRSPPLPPRLISR